MRKIAVARWADLPVDRPTYALVEDVDLVVVRYSDSDVSVFYGRCLHRGALLSDGFVRGKNLICGVHDWDYRVDTGVSEYSNDEALPRFEAFVEGGEVLVNADEVADWAKVHPQPYDRDAYLGAYADTQGTPDEPATHLIHALAKGGIEGVGHHGPIGAMGVPPTELPRWDDLQLLTGQLHRFPLLDDEDVATETVIGPRAKRPLRLEIPLFVSDMSFGALSEEAKVALAKGAEGAGTGICSGEGGMLPDEQQENSRYLYELASARFGYDLERIAPLIQAFHFKGGQGAKTGTGGHLPGNKVQGRIAEVRGLEPGTAAISPSRFPDITSLSQFADIAEEVRAATGGVPIGFKLSAQHIEKDIDAALEVGVDYIILDGRGGGTGAAPLLFRDNISVPTMPALARARRHLDATGHGDVTLVATGGLRTPADFVKAMALGADAIALSNSALQAIGCLAMRACNTNNCPVGIATQREDLRKRLEIAKSAHRLTNFFTGATELMKVLARAAGHRSLSHFEASDLVTWKREIADLVGVNFAGTGMGAGYSAK
ncbi:MAG: glutamate synthase domain-containing protein 2/nitrite reductase [Planctomycetota bacterium]|jgi:glutamate synthase domain-containing protein 2/nitrite reductase/ring-hydroxylating ferredoxin subunit